MADIPAVIVTGASRGVGASVARWLGKAGASVVLMARSKDALDKVGRDVERLGGIPLPVTGDVTDPRVCEKTVEGTLERFGKIDALVNNAAVLEPLATVGLSDPDSWRYNIEVNLLGPFYMIRAAISELRKQKGRIVNVSSGAANIAIQAASSYCTAKAGLNQFTSVLAEEEPSLTCVAVRPGVVDTDMQALIRRQGPKAMPSDQLAYYLNLKSEGQLEPPFVPARSIAWLALYAPNDWSGEFMNYDETRISEPALTVFGEHIE